MKKSISIIADVLTWVVLVALLAAAVLQVTPYWQYEALDIITLETSDATASIQGYVWCNFNHLDLEDIFSSTIGRGYRINDYILFPILAFIPAVAGAVLCVLKRKSWLSGALAVISGVGGILTFTANELVVGEKILAKCGGASFLTPSLGVIVSGVVLALGAALLALRLIELAAAIKAKKARSL